jgi:hypothetical protein
VLTAISRSIATLLLLSTLGCGPRSASPSAAPSCVEPTAPTTTPADASPASATTASTPTADDPLASLAWLAGTWESDDPEGPRTVEHWLAPEAGTMLGVNRTAEGGRTVFFEYLRIEAQAEGLAYLASPGGKDPPTRFGVVDTRPGFVAFENLAHDFPQRIEYRLEGDRLRMQISGTQGGAAKAHAWSMRRVGG